MSDSAYNERLMAQLDGARLVRYDPAGLLYAWHGGHGVHVYNASGAEVDYFSVGDFAENDADVAEVEQSMAARILSLDEIIERADEEGYAAGRAAGSWVVDGNSTEETARRLLAGIEDADPMVLDMLPSSPLSGEWAGDPLPRDVLDGLGLDEDDDSAEYVLRAFEDGFSRGVEHEAVRSARALLGLDDERLERFIESTRYALTQDDVDHDRATRKHRYSTS